MFVDEDNITELAVERWATAHSPRLGELMTALVRHLHAFSREVRLTEDEWMAAIEWLTAAGGISDDKRQELILTSDVLGLSTLVVQLNNTFTPRATPPRSSGRSTSTAHRPRPTASTCRTASRAHRCSSPAG